MKRAVVDGKLPDFLDRVRDAAARMSQLISDLLGFSRINTRAQPFVPVDLEDVLESVLSDLSVRLEEVGGSVETEELPVVEADPTQMRQLLQNLVGNALKFHREGVPPVVRVRAHQVEQPRAMHVPPRVRLEVQDNGIGFDEKFLDRIFTPFQRLHTRRAYEGTGMGLAICRRIVERHNGTITARSRSGHGTTFVVTLPLEQPAVEADDDDSPDEMP